jgi:uncharacterized protein (TIGR03435 family)
LSCTSPDSPGGPAAANTDAPSVFTAVREQLGLKLEMRREMRLVLVIDHVEPPKPDQDPRCRREFLDFDGKIGH